MVKPAPWALCGLLLAAVVSPARAAPAPTPPATQPSAPFELKDGDRVVFVGGTFMEREAQFGYIETMLTTRFPDRNVTFRNLGYAGDTVACEARRICKGWATFGGPDEGFNRLKALIQEIQPTVIVAAYGMGESFGGEAKLPEFVEKYNRLLDMLTTAGGAPAGQVRVVLLSPTYHEDLGPPLPDPAEHNRQIKAYADAIAGIASARGARYVDLYDRVGSRPVPPPAPGLPVASPRRPMTDGGIHLTRLGYLRAATVIASSLGYSAGPYWKVDADVTKPAVTMSGARVDAVKAAGGGLQFTATDTALPFPIGDLPTVWVQKADVAGVDADLRVIGLAPGQYTLKGGGVDVWTDTAEKWAAPIGLSARPADAPDVRQAEELRKLVVAKNADFFHYWRPQNDTYILGYRKGEQGRNAVELPQFKPLVEAKEKEIARLRVPQPVAYTLERVQDGQK